MKMYKILALSFLYIAAMSAAVSQTTSDPTPTKINGPAWILGSQSVVTCERIGEKDNCVTVAVPKNLGKVTGILKLRPIRNSSASWWVFTTQTLAVCGVQLSTKQVACFAVDGLSAKSRPSYPVNGEQLNELVRSFEPHLPAFLAASAKVRVKLTPADEFSTMSDHCYETDECVEDMPRVIIDGNEGVGGGGGGFDEGNFGHDYSGGDGIDNIDPTTGQPYPQVFIYPPAPKWPKDITWCSMTGLFCSAPGEMTPPTPEACQRALKTCRDECTSIYDNNRNNLPGSGTDYPSRYRSCLRECMTNHNCGDNF